MQDENRKYNIFGEDVEDRIALDAQIINSKIKTNVYTDIKIEIGKDGIEEWRPVFPNWSVVDINVANLNPKLEEENAIRAAQETALSLQALSQKTFQEKIIRKAEYLKIPFKQGEAPRKILVYLGDSSEQKVMVTGFDEKGMEVTQEQIIPAQPIYQFIEEEKGFELYELKEINKKIRVYLNLAPECHRLHWYCMTRLGLTKSRQMAGPELLHKYHTKQTTNLIPDEEEDNLLNAFDQKK